MNTNTATTATAEQTVTVISGRDLYTVALTEDVEKLTADGAAYIVTGQRITKSGRRMKKVTRYLLTADQFHIAD